MLIDLTATTTKPYFTAAAVRELGIEYKKILAGFGGNIPTQEAVDEFIQTVAEFDDEHDDDDEIAVVCTHGTSRGGYLICRYLIEVKDMAPSEAIRTFEDARGQPFPVERNNFKMDLLTRN